MLWLHLILMLILILVSSRLFTEALEHFGDKAGISAGVVGSIFAAIATALPETSVPIIALLAGTSNQLVNEEISVGAILGAPLMLSTLSTFIMTVSVIKMRGISGRIIPEKSGFIRDLNFFIFAFLLAAIAMYLPLNPIYLRIGISVILIMIYIWYVIKTCLASKNLVEQGHGVTSDEVLLISRLGFKNNLGSILVQLVFALCLLLIGAKGFIDSVEKIAESLQVSVLLLSLIIIPLATELPEKVNSVFWIRKNKDTLAFGNITGAMVFQGTLLPAIGILLTPWQPNSVVETGVFITIIAAAWLRLQASRRGLRISGLLMCGGLYFLYLTLLLSN